MDAAALGGVARVLQGEAEAGGDAAAAATEEAAAGSVDSPALFMAAVLDLDPGVADLREVSCVASQLHRAQLAGCTASCTAHSQLHSC